MLFPQRNGVAALRGGCFPPPFSGRLFKKLPLFAGRFPARQCFSGKSSCFSRRGMALPLCVADAFPAVFRQAFQKTPPFLQGGFPRGGVFQAKAVPFRIVRRNVCQAGRFQELSLLQDGFSRASLLERPPQTKTFSAGFCPARQSRFFKIEKRRSRYESHGRFPRFLEKFFARSARAAEKPICARLSGSAEESLRKRRVCPIVRTGKIFIFSKRWARRRLAG